MIHVVKAGGMKLQQRSQLGLCQLAYMHTRLQTVVDCSSQNLHRLLDRKCSLLAKDVHVFRKLLLRNTGNHLLTNDCDVSFRIIAVFRRTTCAPSKVGTTVPCHWRAASLIARSDFIRFRNRGRSLTLPRWL